LILTVPDTDSVWYWQCLILAVSDTDSSWYWHCRMLTVPDTKSAWHWKCLILTVLDPDSSWCWQLLTLTVPDTDSAWYWQCRILTRRPEPSVVFWLQKQPIRSTTLAKNWSFGSVGGPEERSWSSSTQQQNSVKQVFLSGFLS